MHPIELLFMINFASAVLKAISVTGNNATSVYIDMLNDIGDVFGLGLLLLGLSFEKKRSSIMYPYGKRRALYILGLISMSIFSGLIFAVAVMKTVSLLQGSSVIYAHAYSIYTFIVAFVLNLIGLILLVYLRIKNNLEDPSIIPGLLDSISDSSGSAIALSSIVFLHSLLDVVGSLVLSLVILISAITIGYRYFQILIGRAPPRHILKKVLERILSISDVRDVNIFNAFMITEDEYMLILEVEVDSDRSVEELEKLNIIIENEVKKIDPRFKHVIVEFVAERREPKTYGKLLHEIDNLSD